MAITIDVYFDIVCPWCYIGRDRLRRALIGQPPGAVTLRWNPFQLNPGMPTSGLDRRSYMIAKFGTAERAAHVQRMISEAAQGDGLEIDLDRIGKTPNTMMAHRLVRYLSRVGIAPEAAVDALFRAYLVSGRDIGSLEVLVGLGCDLGADRDELERYLASSDEAAIVEAADMAARRLGIQAVPCFVINRRFALSGAQEPDSFRPFLDHLEVYSGIVD